MVKIFARNSVGKFQLLFVKRYAVGDELDPEYQVRDISNLISVFRIAKAVVDWGFGYDRYKKLQQIFGNDKVVACYYSFNQRLKKNYDREQGRWIVNRTQVMQDYITAVAQEQITWPGASKAEFPWVFDHHLAEMAEYRKTQSGRSEDLLYTHPEGQPDDAVHAGVYALLAEEIFRETGSGSITFAGYYDDSNAW